MGKYNIIAVNTSRLGDNIKIKLHVNVLSQWKFCPLLQVEVIPFAVADCQHGPLEDASGNTVYVGGLHGTMRARHVADVFA